MHLIFCLHSEVTYKDKVNYCSVAVTGDIFVCGHLGHLIKLTYVNFECDESQRNSIMAYLQHYGSAKSAPIPLAIKYCLTFSTSYSSSVMYSPPMSRIQRSPATLTLCMPILTLQLMRPY
jgi:hypothetical protein